MPISQVPFAGISNPVNFRNIVINGAMSIAQRATSVASITASGYYTLDRFLLAVDTLGTWTQSQSTDTPTGQGFATSLKLDCTTADASPAAGDVMILAQKFEGQNLQYLKKGTANAVSLTASFWVKSTKTGTFIVELFDNDNARQVSKSYTVNTTNTWEFKTVTFPADTTGVLDNDNGLSFALHFWLGAGSTFTSGTLNTSWASQTDANRAVGQVNIADSDSNDWLITGVQLEAGEQASGFEFLPIDVSLGRCRRYFISYGGSYVYQRFGSGFAYNTTDLIFLIEHGIKLRASPTLTYSNISDLATWDGSVVGITSLAFDGFGESVSSVAVAATGRTTNRPYQLLANNSSNARINFSSEL